MHGGAKFAIWHFPIKTNCGITKCNFIQILLALGTFDGQNVPTHHQPYRLCNRQLDVFQESSIYIVVFLFFLVANVTKWFFRWTTMLTTVCRKLRKQNNTVNAQLVQKTLHKVTFFILLTLHAQSSRNVKRVELV